MQNSTPGAGVGLDARSVPKTAESNNGHGSLTRRRNALTCEMCSKKKTKCELEVSSAACTQCMRRNTKCRFTTRPEKRENLKRSQYVKELEERVRKTESLLKAAGLLDEESTSHDEFAGGEGDQMDSDSDRENEESSNLEAISNRARTRRHASMDQGPDSIPTAENFNRNSCPSFSPDNPFTPRKRRRSLPGTSNLQHVPVFRMDGREESRYFGRSSFLSILSREGIEWIKNKTGDTSFLNLLVSDSTHDSPWDYWRPDVFHDLFDSQVYKPLPPRAEVFSMLKDYFRTVNRLFPLYHEDTFMRLVEWQYTQQTCDDAARWASINILLSLAYEYRFSNSLKPEKDKEKAWLYFKNAMSVFTELTLRRTDILSVQALLGMALFLRGNSGTQSALPIITAAMRACHRMGLHRNLPRPHLPPIEQEQRKRVFWVAYILDQSTCVRSGSAPTQHIDDFDVDLPVQGIDDGCLLDDHQSFFRQLCRLSIIKGRIYYRLYSTKALNNKPVAKIFQAIDELHAELEEWKKHSLVDVQLKMKPAGEDFLLGFASAGLRFVYYNSLIMIHRIPLIVHFIHARYIPREKQKLSDLRRIANQSSASSMICQQAARDTLKLVNSLPWGDIAWIWSLLYYVFLAVITIFANILQDSSHPKTKEDIHTLNMASTFFTTLIPGDGHSRYARFMAHMSTNFEHIARVVHEREGKTIRNLGLNDNIPSRLNAGAPLSRVRPNQDADYTTSPTAPGVDIPHIQDIHSNYFRNVSQGITALNLPNTATPNYTTSNAPNTTANVNVAGIYNTNNLFPMTPTTTGADDIHSFSGLQNIAPPPPGLWQIPLALDWEFGNQFLEGMGYPLDLNLSAPPPGPTPQPCPVSTPGLGVGLGVGTAASTPTMPLNHPMDNNMGYGYGNHRQRQQQQQQHQHLAQAQAQDQMVDSPNMAWFGGFMGSYQ